MHKLDPKGENVVKTPRLYPNLEYRDEGIDNLKLFGYLPSELIHIITQEELLMENFESSPGKGGDGVI